MEKIKKEMDYCCNFNSQVAYLENGEKISIEDYIKNRKGSKVFCKENEGNEVEKVESKNNKKINYFRHKTPIKNNQMTQWHLEWQNRFDKKNREIKLGNRRADVMIKDLVVEFQHSRISQDEVKERGEDYKKENKKIIWIIDGNKERGEDYKKERLEISEREQGVFLLYIKTAWIFQNFKSEKYIYINIDDSIYRVQPSHDMYLCQKAKNIDEVVNSLKEGDFFDLWRDQEFCQKPILYLNQRGAGNGKTYEIVSMVVEKYPTRNLFVYLTKTHSAKSIILSEFKNIYGEKIELENKKKLDLEDEDIEGKTYELNYIRENEEKVKIIMGTVDSFIFHIASKIAKDNKNTGDYYKHLAISVSLGDIRYEYKNGRFKYHGENIDKNSMIVIDEYKYLQ